jgi:hypothetical protein
VYGRRETIDAVIAASPPAARVVGHGPGFGIAVIDAGQGPLDVAAEHLSWDVIAFDQRGCLSPRIALVRGGARDAEAFAEHLGRALAARERDVPRGELSDDERRDGALYRQTARAIGRSIAGDTFAVGVDGAPRALALAPPGRNVHIARITDASDLARLLEPFRTAITCVGHEAETPWIASVVGFARGSRALSLGRMQSPPLDGPVDLRGML